MNWKALVVAAALVVSTAGAPVAAAATTSQQGSAQAQSGTHVSFQATDSAIVDYTVNGRTLVEEMSVQSTSEARADAGAEIGLSGDAGFSAAGLSIANSIEAGASTSATIESESGATIEAHDNDRGIMVVTANGESHVARFNSSDSSEAEQESEKRAVIQNDEGDAAATVIVVGEGNVSVSEDGNVTATTANDGRVVYRQYEGERSDSEEQQERLIANGTAVAEVYVQSAADAAADGDDGDDETPTATPTEEPSEEAGERSADVVRYSEDTTVEVTEQSANTVNATVERAQSQGKVVIMSVSEAAFENAEDAQVFVDGEAAAQADSYSEVRSAAAGGDESAYLVRSSGSAEASTDVVVGINHFSARDVSMQSEDGGGDGGSTASDGQPGFGAGLAVVALVGAALLARNRL
jgi:PGF-CTERM protein